MYLLELKAVVDLLRAGVQAIRSPSATGTDEILALFPQNLGGATIDVELVEVRESIGDVSA